jgi:hypothetical protein
MELAQPAVFGKGAGCELVKETCDAYIKQAPAQNYYCHAEQLDGEQLQVTGMQQEWKRGILAAQLASHVS